LVARRLTTDSLKYNNILDSPNCTLTSHYCSVVVWRYICYSVCLKNCRTFNKHSKSSFLVEIKCSSHFYRQYSWSIIKTGRAKLYIVPMMVDTLISRNMSFWENVLLANLIVWLEIMDIPKIIGLCQKQKPCCINQICETYLIMRKLFYVLMQFNHIPKSNSFGIYLKFGIITHFPCNSKETYILH